MDCGEPYRNRPRRGSQGDIVCCHTETARSFTRLLQRVAALQRAFWLCAGRIGLRTVKLKALTPRFPQIF